MFSVLPWLLAIFLEFGELLGGVVPGWREGFWLQDSRVSNRRKSVPRWGKTGTELTACQRWEIGTVKNKNWVGNINSLAQGGEQGGNGKGDEAGKEERLFSGWRGRKQKGLLAGFCSLLIPQ